MPDPPPFIDEEVPIEEPPFELLLPEVPLVIPPLIPPIDDADEVEEPLFMLVACCILLGPEPVPISAL
tara:strand:+ start:297 stop:500 length:204 start_codon:yes stop_codon:yes gene_type:complete